jgi:hypothetical protein
MATKPGRCEHKAKTWEQVAPGYGRREYQRARRCHEAATVVMETKPGYYPEPGRAHLCRPHADVLLLNTGWREAR